MTRLLLLLALSTADAQPAGTVLQAIDSAVAADAGFSAADRRALAAALKERFADYGLQTATAARQPAIKTALRMLVEGSFDEVPAERSADVAFAAYQAVTRGAPAEVVEGIGLYGFRKKIAAERLSNWANGYAQMASNGVPDEVAADLIREAMERDWDDSTFDILKWSIVQAARQKFDVRAYATYLLGHMAQGKRPGALTGEAQSYFRKIAKTGEKPVLPKYEGAFEQKPRPAPAPKPRPAFEPPATAETAKAAPKPRPAEKPPAPPEPAAPARPAAASIDALWPGLDRASRAYLGTPYVWGGVTRRGIDCSALTQNTYGENEIRIPRVSRDQWRAGDAVEGSRWRRGDLVFFNTLGHGVSHVGMVVDVDGPKFIHASSSKGVVIADLSKDYFRSRYLGARRVVP